MLATNTTITDVQGVAKNTPLQKSLFQTNLMFLVNFSEVIRETFYH